MLILESKVIFTNNGEGLNTEECDLLNKYWLLDNSLNPPKFKYKITDLLTKTNMKFGSGKLHKIVQLNSKASCNHPVFKCFACENTFQTNSRKIFLNQFKSTNWECYACEYKRISGEAKPILTVLEEFIKDLTGSTNLTQDSFELKELSFVEKLCLLEVLKNTDYLNSRQIPKNLNQFDMTGSEIFDYEIVNSLISKKAIVYLTKEQATIPSSYQLLQTIYQKAECKPLLEQLKRKILDFDDKFYHLQPGHYLQHDLSSSSFEKLATKLEESLNNHQISFDELEQLQEIIKNNLMNKAYKLLKLVQSEHSFPVKQGCPLETILAKTMNLLTLEQAYGWMNFVGKKVSKDILENRQLKNRYFNSYQENYLFISVLESYLNLIEKGERDAKHKIVPTYLLAPSFLERHTSMNIIKNNVSWISLSGREVMNRTANHFFPNTQ